MKKYIILFIFLPVFLFADIIDEYKHQYSFLKTFKKEGFTKINIKKNQDYEFKVALRKNIKYCFITQGKNEFHIQIYNLCENDGQRIFSRNNKSILTVKTVCEKIYIIKIHSFLDNEINVYWGEF